VGDFCSAVLATSSKKPSRSNESLVIRLLQQRQRERERARARMHASTHLSMRHSKYSRATLLHRAASNFRSRMHVRYSCRVESHTPLWSSGNEPRSGGTALNELFRDCTFTVEFSHNSMNNTQRI
jgi:hypothetical protein